MVSITLRVLSRPDVSHLPKIYQTLGTDYDERVLPSIGNEVLKAIVAQFDAAELITQREVVSANLPLTRYVLSPAEYHYSRSRRGYAKISCSVLESSTSSWRTYLSLISLSAR